ncbi:MAG: cysteine--tRNA ligase [Alphaproteobacteria bacterium]|nr:cysteine--tRNA ligase [Alphaproteobacteria bacterium]
MPLMLHNTMSRKKEAFTPLDPARVRVYVCGPTVYDDPHIGNARPVVVFDVLFRLLRQVYGPEHVTYVRNITDVDDKINARASERGVDIRTLTEDTAKRFRDDMQALGALAPTHEPRATEHIGGMIALIQTLIERGHAYAAEDHVLFAVQSKPDYGCLSHRTRDELIAGARVEVAPYKRDPADFVLWKPSTPDLPGWDSPWGRGRPGWHLECSAMSEQFLGRDFDIHGGGLDLVFPHHENEIAQSTAAFPGTGFARVWLHNGYLVVDGEKMSKSLGNFLTVRGLRAEFPGEALRMALLGTHYRQPLDFTKAGVTRAKRQLDRLYQPLKEAASAKDTTDTPPLPFLAALEDDLNTPLAIHHLRETAQCLNKALTDKDARLIGKFKGELLAGGALMGLAQGDPQAWFHGKPFAQQDGQNPHRSPPKSQPDQPANRLPLTESTGAEGAHVEAQIAERKSARLRKDFAAADRIRKELLAQGVALEDKPDGTTDWKRAG